MEGGVIKESDILALTETASQDDDNVATRHLEGEMFHQAHSLEGRKIGFLEAIAGFDTAWERASDPWNGKSDYDRFNRARASLLYSDDSLGMDKNQNRFPSSATLGGHGTEKGRRRGKQLCCVRA